MNPKQKAKELVVRFYNRWADDSGMGWNVECAKDCALVVVEEIKNANPCTTEKDGEGLKWTTNRMYWIEVQAEIMNL